MGLIMRHLGSMRYTTLFYILEPFSFTSLQPRLGSTRSGCVTLTTVAWQTMPKIPDFLASIKPTSICLIITWHIKDVHNYVCPLSPPVSNLRSLKLRARDSKPIKTRRNRRFLIITSWKKTGRQRCLADTAHLYMKCAKWISLSPPSLGFYPKIDCRLLEKRRFSAIFNSYFILALSVLKISYTRHLKFKEGTVMHISCISHVIIRQLLVDLVEAKNSRFLGWLAKQPASCNRCEWPSVVRDTSYKSNITFWAKRISWHRLGN
jgi:hypothetical protein